MKPRYGRMALLVTCLFLAAIGWRLMTKVRIPSDEPILTSHSSDSHFHLNDAEFAGAKQDAERGDADAATRLAWFYFSSEREQEGLYWLRRASELGNLDSQYNLALHYYEVKSHVMADFWLRKVEVRPHDIDRFDPEMRKSIETLRQSLDRALKGSVKTEH